MFEERFGTLKDHSFCTFNIYFQESNAFAV